MLFLEKSFEKTILEGKRAILSEKYSTNCWSSFLLWKNVLVINDDLRVELVEKAVKLGKGVNELSFCWF